MHEKIMSVSDAYEVDRIVTWVKRSGFKRVALQIAEELLADSPALVGQLQNALHGCKIFVLGDTLRGGRVNEGTAAHYAADCVVHVGPSDQVRVGSLPVLSVFGHSLWTDGVEQVAALELQSHDGPLAIVCEVNVQHGVDKLVAALRSQHEGRDDYILVAVPGNDTCANSCNVHPWLDRRDWRFGKLPTLSWSASLGPLVAAAEARPELLRLGGRELRSVDGRPGPRILPASCGVLYVGAQGSALERRLMLRHCSARPVWRMDPENGHVTKLSSHSLLMQRYRFVEFAKSAGIVGLLMNPTDALHGQALADRLDLLLRRAGRQVYRFILNQVTVEKLGNFPEVECFVSLASPEEFPFNSKEFRVPVASPYEVEVALGAREWSAEYIIDLEELLATPWCCRAHNDVLAVQTLGTSARVRTFESDGTFAHNRTLTRSFEAAASGGADLPPAFATQGQHGVASHYVSLGD